MTLPTNDRSIMRALEDAGCVPDGTANPAELEGMLSNHSDEESSVDWIRAIRDNC